MLSLLVFDNSEAKGVVCLSDSVNQSFAVLKSDYSRRECNFKYRISQKCDFVNLCIQIKLYFCESFDSLHKYLAALLQTKTPFRVFAIIVVRSISFFMS